MIKPIKNREDATNVAIAILKSRQNQEKYQNHEVTDIMHSTSDDLWVLDYRQDDVVGDCSKW